MVHYFKDSPKRRVDESLEITDLYIGEGKPLDCVIGDLDGFHGTFINHTSDKNYLILDGSGVVVIDGKKYTVNVGDFIRVPKNVKHSIEGKCRFALLCNPPYDFQTEDSE